jgi:carbonic anhydrase
MDRIVGFLGRRNLLKSMGIAGVSYAASVACTPSTTTKAAVPAANSAATNSAATNCPSTEIPTGIAKRPDAKDLTPDDALKLVMDGNQRFVDGKTFHPRSGKESVIQTGSGQFPFAAFLGCADSRVPIETVFDQGIGDCFVCRVAGNISSPETVGSLEFGTLVLGSKLILVLGHGACGAVVAAMGRLDEPSVDLKDLGMIPSLVPYLTPSVKEIAEKVKKEGIAKVPDDLEATIQANAKIQAAALAKSSILSKLIAAGKLKILPAYYDITSGKVTLLT